ncbi:MAG TPA: SCO family protein [Verrucomicrobiae bacterium]|jgi:protein SCO1/2|nr:SCO family protein [Verrucomicrobiae bacterium]
MRPRLLTIVTFLSVLLASTSANSETLPNPAVSIYSAHGVVEEIKSDSKIVIIRHQAISNYMAAMTMPFNVKDTKELAGLQRGSLIDFNLYVTTNESWVARLVKTGSVTLPPVSATAVAPAPESNFSDPKYELLYFKFTNEVGHPFSLGDFPGQALAITFFYTRCPLPDFCPRLSKNFQSACEKLEALPGAPTNWHFLSISFDPEFDSPEVLKAYGQFYQYDPAHWSFVTGPKDKIRELATRTGVTMQNRDGAINHNFRTLIIDASGRLQMIFPTSGDLSDAIVAEIIKGAAATNAVMAQNQKH